MLDLPSVEAYSSVVIKQVSERVKIDSYQRVYLVHNAATLSIKPLEDLSTAEIMASLQVNIAPVFIISRDFLNALRDTEARFAVVLPELLGYLLRLLHRWSYLL